MKRFIMLAFFILLFAIQIISQHGAYASPTSEILCNGWLAGTTGIDCSTGNCTPNPSPDDGGKSSDTYTISDHIGVRGVCKDYFPTYGEREMFYRTSDDPLNMDLIIERQYCWARYVFIPQPDNCGGPDWKWAFPFGYLSWGKGVNYAIWGDTVTKTFSLQERGSDNAQTIFWGSNHAYIDYEKIKRGNDEIDNPKRICAYFSPVAFGKIVSGSDRLIGCIDIPLNPAPNIYNKTIIPKSSVAVDKGTPDDSSFIEPKINLKIINSAGQNVGSYIPLSYNFRTGIKNCSEKTKTLGDVYCPFIQPSDPTKICAGLQGKPSSNIGCVDRPKPSGTKNGAIYIEAIHGYYIDNNCPDIDNKPSIFHSVKIQLKDSATNKVIKEFPGAGNGLRDYYACYQIGQNPTDQSIEKSILSGHDTVDVCGIQFSAIIPEFIDDDGKNIKDYTEIGIEKIRPKNFRKTHLYPPIMLGKADGTTSLGSCDSCFYYVSDKSQCIDNNPTSKQSGQSMCATYNTPAGERDRDSCEKDHKCYDFEHNPLPIGDITKNSINCKFSSDSSQLNEAEKAYCPGIYKLEQKKKSAICINLDTNWPDFFGKQDKICAEIPGSFMKLGKNDISSLTKYVDFTDDKFDLFKEYKGTDQLYGECDASLNLENEKCLSSDKKECLSSIPDKIKGLTDAQVLDFKDKYSVINQYLYGNKGNLKNVVEGVNANIQAIDKNLMSNLGYSSSGQEFSIIYTAPFSLGDGKPKPYRKLDGNFPIGSVYYGCRFTVGEDGCGKNTDTAPFLGNAYFDASNYNLNIGTQLAITKNVNTTYPTPPLDGTGLVIKDVYIDGKCEDGLAPASDGLPQRICRVIVDKKNNIITKSWSNQAVFNSCVNAKKPNG